MAIKFPLKFRGVDVRNIDDLRENFELNAAIEYFRNGKLIQWLRSRYFDDEAKKISELDENAPDFREKLCAALGVPCEGKTFRNDGGIVYEMFRWDENGNIISAPTAAADLDEEREYQPVTENKSAVNDELREIFATIFGEREVWEVIDREGKILFGTKANGSPAKKISLARNENTPKTLTPTQKKMFLKKICNGEYTEDDLIFIRAVEDFSSGFALTKDAFCYGGDLREEFSGDGKILYSEIDSLEFIRAKEKESQSLDILDANRGILVAFDSWDMEIHCSSKIINNSLLWKLGTFLEFAKD